MITQKVLVILFTLFLSALPVSANTGLTTEQIRSLFEQSNQAFRQANSLTAEADRAKQLYKKAILNYEKIINDGRIRNAGLYYNLANAYFLEGDLGKAILNYRRAENLDAGNANIQKNLAFARSRRIDKVRVKTEKKVLQTLFFWHYDFAIKTRFILTCLFFAIVCLVLTVVIWFGRSAALTAAVVTGVILTLCFFVSVVVDARVRAGRTCGVITAEQVISRQGDGANYAGSFKDPLHTGTEFDLLEHRPGWLHIKLSDDTDGWIPDNSAELI